MKRTAHLLKRAAGDVQGGRADFAVAEASLDADPVPIAMSRLTRQWFDAIDFDAVASRRRRNAFRLFEGLHRLGLEPMDPGGQVPLCLPVAGLDPVWWRPRLAEHGIFCPVYWPGLDPEGGGAVERRLVTDTTFLPIDHRYEVEDMDRVLGIIDDLRKSA